jgi:hypothetical protein
VGNAALVCSPGKGFLEPNVVDLDESAEYEGQMMPPDSPCLWKRLKDNNPLAKDAS